MQNGEKYEKKSVSGTRVSETEKAVKKVEAMYEHEIDRIEGRDSDYYTSDEAIKTANAVLRMANGTATRSDYALIERSEGARTVVLSAEGTKAWDSMKAEADKRVRNAEYGMKSDNPSGSSSHLPLHKGGSGVRSEASETSGVKYKVSEIAGESKITAVTTDKVAEVVKDTNTARKN